MTPPQDPRPETSEDNLLRRRFEETQRLAAFGSWELDLRENDIRTGPVWWSDETYRLLGYEPGAVRACSENFFARLAPEEAEEVTRRARASAVEGFAEWDCRVVLPGGTRHLHVRSTLVRGETGAPVRLVGTIQDVTARVSAAAELRESHELLEQRVVERTAELTATNRELEDLSYSITHDLRAPLRSIDGFARILQEETAGQLPAAAADCLQRITRSAAHMGHLIDALLDFSRVGRQDLGFAGLDMDALAAATIRELEEAAAGRAIDWVLAPLPPARADRALLRQVWVQLISNAIKFTRGRDPARIEVGAEAGTGVPVYFVRDNGAGFDPRYAQRLFSVFQRLHRSDEFEGAGVGLAIARRAVARHGGRIWAQGAPGEGACVRFTLWESATAPSTE